MRLGKLSNDQLERLVLRHYICTREESLGAPKVGEDCAALLLPKGLVVFSTDPITSASSHIGRLSVHVNCNDAAAAGAEPIGILVTILAPPDATEAQIENIAKEISDTAREIHVDVLGGHTEVTDSVTRFVTSTTVIARMDEQDRLTGLCAGDDIVMTKWAGLEGSIVLAADYRHRLPMLLEEEIQTALSWLAHISVVPEGRYAAKHGATAMHDVTEGGIYGAAWELGYASNVGITLYPEKIPVHPVTSAMCEALSLDCMRLLSSGCMLIGCKNGASLAGALNALGIPACVIGVAGGEGVRLADGTLLPPPEADELYRVF